MKTSTLVLPFVLVVAACGGSTPPPEPPPSGGVTSTTTSTETTTATPAPSAAPSAAPTAAPAGGQCKSAEAPATATDLDTCKAGCQKLDDSVPPGTRCISERASCMSQCNTKYKK